MMTREIAARTLKLPFFPLAWWDIIVGNLIPTDVRMYLLYMLSSCNPTLSGLMNVRNDPSASARCLAAASTAYTAAVYRRIF